MQQTVNTNEHANPRVAISSSVMPRVGVRMVETVRLKAMPPNGMAASTMPRNPRRVRRKVRRTIMPYSRISPMARLREGASGCVPSPACAGGQLFSKSITTTMVRMPTISSGTSIEAVPKPRIPFT